MQPDQTNTITLERDFYGYAGAGPLTVAFHTEGPGRVHIGWGTGGMYLTAIEARRLARFIHDVAAECD